MAEAIDELLNYEKGWANQMGYFWRERMERLRTIDTGALYSSIKAHVEQGTVTTIEHNFLQYGIYVAAGVGPAHVWKKWTEAQGGQKILRPNGGDLDFLNKQYRADHDLDTPRKVGPAWGGRIAGGEPKGRRDWFSQKYYSSVMRLNEHEADFYGETYNGLMASALTEIFRGIGTARNL